MTDSSTYQGWTNWDTWNANLWLTNDQYLYNAAMTCQDARAVRALFMETFADSTRFWGEHPYLDGINPDAVNWQEILDSLQG